MEPPWKPAIPWVHSQLSNLARQQRHEGVADSWTKVSTWPLESPPRPASLLGVEHPRLTRVELEHRHLERHGTGWERARVALESDEGWPVYLNRFSENLSAHS